MALARIKKDTMIVVLSGADKGKTGKVLSVDVAKQRVLVEGVNRRRKTLRRTPANPQGGLDEVECPIHVSNVMEQSEYERRQSRKGQAPAESKDSK